MTRPCAHGVTVLAGGKTSLTRKLDMVLEPPQTLPYYFGFSGCVIPSNPAEFKTTHRYDNTILLFI